MKYTLALRTGGLMESPGWHYENIRVVEGNDLRDARQKYAEMTGLDKYKDWNPVTQLYWGYSIVDMVEEMNNIQR